MKQTKRFPLWATLLTIAGIAALCGLGTWQLQRLSWKESLLAQLAAEYEKDPMAQELTAAQLASLPADRDFARGFVEGIYLHDKSMAVGPRTHEGQPGYHIITPFETLQNDIILVNRGWVPLEAKNDHARPTEPLIVPGIARRPETGNPFTPENRPEKNEWYKIDIAQMEKAQGLENVLPFVLYAESNPGASPYPMAAATRWMPENNHLAYALFWFTMAGTLAVIYALRFVVIKKKP